MEDYSDLELLAELVRRNDGRLTPSPKARQFVSPHRDLCVGIGPDHTADITLGDDDLAELRRLTA